MRGSTRLGLARAGERRHQGRIAAQRSTHRRCSVDHQVEAASVAWGNARSSGVAKPLLRDYLTVGANSFACDPHPCPFDVAEPTALCEGRPRHDRRTCRRARRNREGGHTDLIEGGVGGADGGARRAALQVGAVWWRATLEWLTRSPRAAHAQTLGGKAGSSVRWRTQG